MRNCKIKNMNADSGEKTWITPKDIIDRLGPFGTDPCCPDKMPWKTACRMITKKQDGRTARWCGRVWLNPPYGKEALPFLERMAHYTGGGIAMIFARTDTEAWHKYVFPFAHSIMFLKRRIRFCSKDGLQKSDAVAPSALISYSALDTNILQFCGIPGTIVRLKQ